jgi:regulatory protein
LQETKTNKARAAALRLLAVRDRSGKEVRERLEKRFSEEEVNDAVEFLTKLGYLDDLRYAENYVAYRNEFRPRGNYLLQMELRTKGVSDEIVERVLNSEEKELGIALSFGEKYLERMGKVDVNAKRRRLYGALQRRGFSQSVVWQVVRQLLDSDLEKEYN